jgi:hypothetical protein
MGHGYKRRAITKRIEDIGANLCLKIHEQRTSLAAKDENKQILDAAEPGFKLLKLLIVGPGSSGLLAPVGPSQRFPRHLFRRGSLRIHG